MDEMAGSAATGKARGEGAPALTRVLDLARPVICALGTLVTHLEVTVQMPLLLSCGGRKTVTTPSTALGA